MAELVLLTADPGGAVRALPALALLRHRVTLAPLTMSALVAQDRADVLLVDGRHDLVGARALCRTAGVGGTLPEGVPLLLVLAEGGFAAVSTEWGAWDVVLESAGPAEVEARLRMLLDRSAPARAQALAGSGAGTGIGSGPGDEAEVIEAGDLVIDTTAYTARVRGRVLDLTFREFELLRHLAAHPARVHTRAQLLQAVWGYEYYGGTRTVDVHVRRLRAKLGAEHDQPIGTVRNVGYRFEVRAAGSGDDRPGDDADGTGDDRPARRDAPAGS
ncbi:winged helix-turn-helix domain-containing protein [Georgenia sp. Z1344]|uniref:winged helix family transcriptional regulator n=1 Tax=Georgenia sp. Z1344 TaxID=3416706 RepID=UPI003CF4C1A3